jgi:hypothetical protein
LANWKLKKFKFHGEIYNNDPEEVRELMENGELLGTKSELARIVANEKRGGILSHGSIRNYTRRLNNLPS